MVFASAVGGGYGLLGVAPFLVLSRTRRRAFELLAAIVLTAVMVFVVKHAVGRIRPYACLEGVQGLFFAPPRDPSFPSGHAAGSACFAAFLADRSRPVRTALLAAFALFVGLSRIVLGVHFPLDVITGATLGTAVGVSIRRYFDKVRETPASPEPPEKGISPD
jgi:undecaprenyl-diphosphatase